MVIHELDRTPRPELQRALEEFESTFLVPFAPGRFYRIDYGSDRTGFIRTLGESRLIAAEKDGRILGLVEMAVVELLTPGGATRPAVYFADIKVAPEARRALTTARILQRAVEWSRARSDFWFTLTLEGTPVKPPDYSGRAGIPAFTEAGRIIVVRLPITRGERMPREDRRFLAENAEGADVYRWLARERYALLGAGAEVRSMEPPVWMVHPGGRACARLEDRRKVRRLIADDGSELRPAYLSCFAFQNSQAAVDLIIAALARAEGLGYRALRFCLPPGDLAALQRALGPGVIGGSEGTIFTNHSSANGIWNLNAAEI